MENFFILCFMILAIKTNWTAMPFWFRIISICVTIAYGVCVWALDNNKKKTNSARAINTNNTTFHPHAVKQALEYIHTASVLNFPCICTFTAKPDDCGFNVYFNIMNFQSGCELVQKHYKYKMQIETQYKTNLSEVAFEPTKFHEILNEYTTLIKEYRERILSLLKVSA